MTNFKLSSEKLTRIKNEKMQYQANNRTDDLKEYNKYLIPVFLFIFCPVIIATTVSGIKNEDIYMLIFVSVLCLALIIPSILIAKHITKRNHLKESKAIAQSEFPKAELKGQMLFLTNPDNTIQSFDITEIKNLKYYENNVIRWYDEDTGKEIRRVSLYEPHIEFSYQRKKYNIKDVYEPSLYETIKEKIARSES